MSGQVSSRQGDVVRARIVTEDGLGHEVVGVVVSGENGEGVVVVASGFDILGGGRIQPVHENRAMVTEVFRVNVVDADADVDA